MHLSFQFEFIEWCFWSSKIYTVTKRINDKKKINDNLNMTDILFLRKIVSLSLERAPILSIDWFSDIITNTIFYACTIIIRVFV